MPVEPPPSRWQLPDPRTADDDVVAVGADLQPGTILAAYRAGMFPMGIGSGPRAALGWWSPEPRGILPLDRFRMTRSLRRSCRRYEVTVDADFNAVIAGCADARRAHGWITDDIRDAYLCLHRLGWVHSVETWDGDRLVGGLYGVSIGGLFAGESMFHRATDASKVALAHLVDAFRPDDVLLDVQWVTPHLASLGAVAIPRGDYLVRLQRALQRPSPQIFEDGK